LIKDESSGSNTDDITCFQIKVSPAQAEKLSTLLHKGLIVRDDINFYEALKVIEDAYDLILIKGMVVQKMNKNFKD
jgi:hypothetical protein